MYTSDPANKLAYELVWLTSSGCRTSGRNGFTITPYNSCFVGCQYPLESATPSIACKSLSVFIKKKVAMRSSTLTTNVDLQTCKWQVLIPSRHPPKIATSPLYAARASPSATAQAPTMQPSGQHGHLCPDLGHGAGHCDNYCHSARNLDKIKFWKCFDDMQSVTLPVLRFLAVRGLSKLFKVPG